jgi:transposase
MDEVHFQYGSRCRMWIPPETKDPVLLHRLARRRVRISAWSACETDKFNALTCWQFLKYLRAASTHAGRRVVVIVDNARFHHARLPAEWRREHSENFVRAFLPAYRPELNPPERVWKLTRRRCLHNRYFAQLNGVILALETEFANWIKPNNTLRRLCAIS